MGEVALDVMIPDNISGLVGINVDCEDTLRLNGGMQMMMRIC